MQVHTAIFVACPDNDIAMISDFEDLMQDVVVIATN